MIIKLNCQWCKKEFEIPFKQRDQKFCSLSCTSMYGWSLGKRKRALFEKPCDICSKPIKTTPYRVKEGRGKYCSKACYIVAMKRGEYAKPFSEESRIKLSKKRIGKLNPAFKHGKSPGAKRYKGTFPRRIKEKVRQRDNYTCQKCFVKESELPKKLSIHHLDENPLNDSLDNLLSVCNSCHHSYFHIE